MLKFKSFALALAVSATFIACKNSKYPGFEETETGIYYKFFKKGTDTITPKEGDVAEMKIVYKLRDDSVLFDSRKATPTGIITNPFRKPFYKGSLEEGFLMMHAGDSAAFIINTDSLLSHLPPPKDSTQSLPKNSYLTAYVKLEKIIPAAVAQEEQKKRYEEFMKQQEELKKANQEEEPKRIAAYIEKNKVTQKPDKDGLYYIETAAGTGAPIKVGKKVTVNYTGKLLDGTVFDASANHDKPFTFTIGNKEVIPGWDAGLVKMKKGGKATLIIPSAMAYGPEGIREPNSGNYAIQPYTPLVFDLEVVEVE